MDVLKTEPERNRLRLAVVLPPSAQHCQWSLENGAKASVGGDRLPWAAGFAVGIDCRLAMSGHLLVIDHTRSNKGAQHT